jgi:hypothetical protein
MSRLVRIPPGYQPRISPSVRAALRQLYLDNRLAVTGLLIKRFRVANTPVSHFQKRHEEMKKAIKS